MAVVQGILVFLALSLALSVAFYVADLIGGTEAIVAVVVAYCLLAFAACKRGE